MEGAKDTKSGNGVAEKGINVKASAPQISIGRWVKDTDLEAQKAAHNKMTVWSFISFTYAATGVIYGDIGTSPLYTMASIFAEFTPTEDQVVGVTCLMIWSLTLLTIIKYCILVLICDDNGEGGTFALYSLIARYSHISPGNTATPDSSDLELSRYSSSSSLRRKTSTGSALRRFFHENRAGQLILLFLALIGTALVLGDGVLTPAQSVLGAVYGLQYKASSLSTNAIVGISCAVVIIIFGVNPFGTVAIGKCYGPIVLIWFLFNIITAIHNMVVFMPGIWKAWNPYYGYLFFAQLRNTGWRALAGVFLTITGSEAIFADIGHFGKNPIRVAFIFIAYPALCLTYLGQGAWAAKNIDSIGSTFFASIPYGDGFYWTFFIVAILAASVASQAMISGAFQIVKQSIALGCFPRVTVKSKNVKMAGSVYIPEVNWVMMVLTIVVICIFKTTTVLGYAYGVALSAMMFITTVLTSLVYLMVYDANVFLVLAFFLIFGFMDMVYLSANLNKIPSGGWFAVAVAGGVFIVSAIWWWGTSKKGKYLREHKVKVEELLEVSEDPKTPGAGGLILRSMATGEKVTRVPGLAILYTDTVLAAPPLLPNLVSQWGAIHKALVLVTVRRVLIPSVDPAERLLFSYTTLPGVYRTVVRYGYMDRVEHDAAFTNKIVEQIVGSLNARAQEGGLDEPLADAMEGLTTRPAIYIISRTALIAKPSHRPVLDFFRRGMLETVYGTMARFARHVSDDWGLQPQQCFEVRQVFHV